MSLHFTRGDMFEVAADVRVNPVNCVGVMGKGLAAEFKRRYPAMFEVYRCTCEVEWVRPGQLHIWYTEARDLTIVNFPTKRDWRDKSRLGDIEVGLQALRLYLEDRKDGLVVAVPALGCGEGGLSWSDVRPQLEKYLGGLKQTILAFEPTEVK